MLRTPEGTRWVTTHSSHVEIRAVTPRRLGSLRSWGGSRIRDGAAQALAAHVAAKGPRRACRPPAGRASAGLLDRPRRAVEAGHRVAATRPVDRVVGEATAGVAALRRSR